VSAEWARATQLSVAYRCELTNLRITSSTWCFRSDKLVHSEKRKRNNTLVFRVPDKFYQYFSEYFCTSSLNGCRLERFQEAAASTSGGRDSVLHRHHHPSFSLGWSIGLVWGIGDFSINWNFKRRLVVGGKNTV
jgi:hypothetical protein